MLAVTYLVFLVGLSDLRLTLLRCDLEAVDHLVALLAAVVARHRLVLATLHALVSELRQLETRADGGGERSETGGKGCGNETRVGQALATSNADKTLQIEE